MKRDTKERFENVIAWILCSGLAVIVFALLIVFDRQKSETTSVGLPTTPGVPPILQNSLPSQTAATPPTDHTTYGGYQHGQSELETQMPYDVGAIEQRIQPYDARTGKPYDMPLDEWQNAQRFFSISDPDTTQAEREEAGRALWYFHKQGEL